MEGTSGTGFTGFRILAAALALGILGDGLLRGPGVGLNVFLLAAAVVGSALVLGRGPTGADRPRARLAAAAALVFAAAAAWRDAPVLTFMNILALLGCLGLFMLYAREGDPRRAGIAEYALGLAAAGLHVLFGSASLLLSRINWREALPGRQARLTGAILRGMLIALPLLLLFGALFMSADPVFARLVRDLAVFDLGTVVSHLLTAGLLAWLAGGFLQGAVLEHPLRAVQDLRVPAASLGRVETAVVLGTLNALFLAFVAVQLGYLFGGAERVAAVTGLTYAEYARRGFFELAAASGLVLPTLLAGHWLVTRRNGDPAEPAPAAEGLFRPLAAVLVALVFVVMASALQRMALYQQAYGLTELRLYTTVFMGWLALVFLWFCVTVLRRRRDRFAPGALAAALVVLLLLNALNPHGFIVRVNGQRLQAGLGFDAHHAAGLSADAVPELVRLLPALEPGDQALITQRLVLRRQALAKQTADWRSWNWGRWQAHRAVATLGEDAEGDVPAP